MHPPLPERIDVDRAVASGRVYEGVLPLAGFSRLRELLFDAEGEVSYRLRFDRAPMGRSQLLVEAEGRLPLMCQTSLERFEHPVLVRTRLGVIDDEADEAKLAEGLEPCLSDAGRIDPRAVIEDELLLMVPVVARRPDASEILARMQPALPAEAESEPERANPFAALAGLKRQ